MSTELSLYGQIENLTALLDTQDMVSDEQRVEIEREIVRVALQVEKKVDSVSGFIRHCKATEDNIDAEIARLKALKAHYASGEARCKGYVADIIRASGKDAKGKYRPLEGRTSVMRLQTNGGVQALEIALENAIPTHLGKFHGAIGEQHYRRLRELCGDDPNTLAELDRMTWQVDTGAVRAILERGSEVPGASLLPRGESLRVL